MSDIDFDKAKGQFMLQLNPILKPFMYHGFKDLIPGAKEEIFNLALQLHDRLNGLDVPIQASSRIRESWMT
jgi:hypothetical protein